MKILVTGASGRIGERLVHWLETKTSYDLILTSRRQPKFDCQRSVWIQGDLRNIEDLNRIFSYEPDVVIHLAAAVGAKNSASIESYEAIELMPTIRLLDYILNKQLAVKFIFASSGGTVYQDGKAEHIETERIECSSLYSCNKIYVENLLWLYKKSLHPIILRISNPFGMTINPNINQGIIDIAVNCAKTNQIFSVWGNVSNIRDFIHIDDLCAAFMKVINFSSSEFEIFNIGSGIGVSISEIIACIKRYSPGFKYEIIRNEHCGDISSNILNISKARSLLNWQPTIPVETYLRGIFQKDANLR